MEKVEEATLPNRPIDDESKKSPQTISILVVDHDTTCLAIVAAILKKFKYEVVTVKHANDALCMLRIKGGEFDLVVSDVHMPDMNGFELQRAIAQEFDNLPVVLMSADEEEGVALRGLENGAVFFICKPVCPDDVQDLWQFASTKRRQSNVKIHEEKNKTCNETTIASVASSAVPREGLKKKPISQEISDNAKKGESSRPTGASSSSQKKAKIVWTNSLHNRFLEAIRSIGLDRAVPKKILEVMNVPGLTRENVASHLQKYRIFLRRVSDASYNVQYPTEQKRIGISSSGRSLFMSSSSSSSTQPTFPLLNRFPYRKFGGQYFPSSSPGSLMINQPGIFRQPKLSIPFTPQQPPQPLINPLTGPTTLMNPTAVAPTNPSYFNDITTPSNYVGYSLSDLQHLAGNNAPAPVEPLNVDDYMDESTFDSSFGDLSSVIGDYAQLLSSNPPNVGNNFPMLDLHQGDLFDILNQPQPQPQPQSQPQPQPQVGNFTTAGNFFDNMSPWDQNSAPSFDPAPTNNQQFCNQDLVNPQEFTATSTGQLNNTRQSMQIPPIPNEQVSQGLTNNDFQGFNNPSSQLRDKTQLATTVVEPDLDEFLESLLIPFGDIQSLEGI